MAVWAPFPVPTAPLPLKFKSIIDQWIEIGETRPHIGWINYGIFSVCWHSTSQVGFRSRRQKTGFGSALGDFNQYAIVMSYGNSHLFLFQIGNITVENGSHVNSIWGHCIHPSIEHNIFNGVHTIAMDERLPSFHPAIAYTTPMAYIGNGGL